MKRLIYLLMFVVIACGDDDEPEPQPSKISLITAHQWELVTVGNQPPQVEETITFNANGSFAKQSNVITNGTWQFTNNEAKISMAYSGGGNYTAEIMTLTATELILKFDHDQLNHRFIPVD